MKKLEVRFTTSAGQGVPVGILAEQRGRVFFEYAGSFLATGLDLSPFRLPFEPGLFEHRDREFGPLPGVFDDSLPDGWGRLLLDRYLRGRGQDPAQFGPLERLAWLGSRTMGALTYHPPAGPDAGGLKVLDLHDLERQSQAVLAGAAREVLPQLLSAGGSPGGARPKVLVGYNPDTEAVVFGGDDLPLGFEHWMVKFAAEADLAETGSLEYAYSLMAREAGLEMPPTRLFETPEGDRFFGVRRFDRGPRGEAGNQRRHMHTFGNLLHLNFRVPSADYGDLLKATRLLTRNHREVLRAFRCMVFNVLAHNRDDHVKNFAFLLDDRSGDWELSPAYDLLFTPGPGGEHTMTVAGEGKNPGRPHLLKLAAQAQVSSGEASQIIEEVQAAVARWSRHAAKAGVPRATSQRLAKLLPRLS
jgi:serine/threonine-protein kinase HipA